MRKWKTIHGFEIDNTSPRPHSRRNFIFLKNPEEVPKAVQKQFSNYSTSPARYSLSETPTLEEAIRKFDQDKPVEKMKFLRTKFPEIRFDAPLSTLF
jgi:hypothetical protein